MPLEAIAAGLCLSGFGLIFVATINTGMFAMASPNHAALAAAVNDLLTELQSLRTEAAKPHPAEAALADETASEDQLTALIRSVVPEKPAPTEGA